MVTTVYQNNLHGNHIQHGHSAFTSTISGHYFVACCISCACCREKASESVTANVSAPSLSHSFAHSLRTVTDRQWVAIPLLSLWSINEKLSLNPCTIYTQVDLLSTLQMVPILYLTGPNIHSYCSPRVYFIIPHPFYLE